ncbi:MAG: hypothetical protein WD066_06380 [Planctomycetaceae bacterium]
MLRHSLLLGLVLLCAVAWGSPRWFADIGDPFLWTESAELLPWMIAATMFASGALLPRDEFANVLRRWPTVLFGTAVQYTAMPVVAIPAAAYTFGCMLTGTMLARSGDGEHRRTNTRSRHETRGFPILTSGDAPAVSRSHRVRHDPRSAIFQVVPQLVSFLPGDFEVEHQVFDVEAQLRQGFLNQGQNPSPPPHGVDHPLIGRLQFRLVARGQGADLTAQLE